MNNKLTKFNAVIDENNFDNQTCVTIFFDDGDISPVRTIPSVRDEIEFPVFGNIFAVEFNHIDRHYDGKPGLFVMLPMPEYDEMNELQEDIDETERDASMYRGF